MFGVIMHYAIALIWTATFYVACLRVPIIMRRPILSGLIYGGVVYLIMNFVALPLSAVPHTRNDHTRVTDQRSARHFVVHWTTHLASYPQNTVSNAHLTFRGRERHQQQNETARRVCAECKEKRLEPL